MFIIALIGSLVAGVAFGTFLLYRWRINPSIAVLALVFLCILVAASPFDLGTRVALAIGVLLGFLIAVTASGWPLSEKGTSEA